MMKMMKMSMLAAIATMSGIALSDVSVDNIVCTQRYPWNGLVDIDYTIACDDPNAEIYVNPVGFNGDTGLTVFPTHFTGDGATNTVKAGRHRMVWDAKADMGAFSSKNFQIKMYAGKELSRYIVVDISGGTNATNFAIRRSIEGPNLDNDTCRTTEIWMRLIPPGTFMMGSPTNELGRSDNEDLHRVTITKPFYIGVFEVTQRQWELVKGNRPSYFTTSDDSYQALPVEQIDCYSLRIADTPSVAKQNEVSPSTFLVLLRTKTNMFGFDLPSEAQWEYACRAGMQAALNSGANLMGTTGCSNLSKLCGYSANVEKTQRVGTFTPNKIGLYDMHGNVKEWCVDGYYKALGFDDRVDPVGAWTNVFSYGCQYNSVARGGSYADSANDCRSAVRKQWAFYEDRNTYAGSSRYKSASVGFRLCCTGNLQQ